MKSRIKLDFIFEKINLPSFSILQKLENCISAFYLPLTSTSEGGCAAPEN